MPKPQIILLSPKALFREEFITPLGNLSVSDTSMLYSVLLMNLQDNIKRINADLELSLFLCNKDQDNVPVDFPVTEYRFFDPAAGYRHILSHISKRINSGNTQFIILYGNTIGFSPKEYQKIINLMNYDDNSLVLGKSPDDKISMLGFNYFDNMLLEKLHDINPDVQTLLTRANGLDYFLFIQDAYPFIRNIEDFRMLYKMLSTKESIEYCSHEIHEQFTHLFIEYKESLK